MATVQQPASQGSDQHPRHATQEEKKRKRMEANRESAKRTRRKKQQHLQDLHMEDSRLAKEINLSKEKFNDSNQERLRRSSEISFLRAELAKRTNRLRSLNEENETLAKALGINLDIPGVLDALFEPCQPPYVMQSMASVPQY